MQDVIYKHPAVTREYEVDFTDQLSDTDTSLTGEGVSAIDSNGDVQAGVLGGIATSGLIATVTLQDGVDGEDYTITVTATGDSSSQIAALVLEMRVRIDELGNF